MRQLIAVVVAEFLTCCDIACGHNPEGVVGFFHDTVRLAGMVDVACRIVQGLAINGIAVIQVKDVDIACGATARALLAGNFFPAVSHNPGPLGDSLRRKESLTSNTRWTNTYLNLHRIMPHCCSITRRVPPAS